MEVRETEMKPAAVTAPIKVKWDEDGWMIEVVT